MVQNYERLADVQQLVLDVMKVNRNHRIPGTERRENVVEHSFSVAMLCWRIHDSLGLDLDLEKIFKYALVHDFPERGQNEDTNTYATPSERLAKLEREQAELIKMAAEFSDFNDFTNTLRNYEECADEEAQFVWSVDKMQAIILGQIDDWRPYAAIGVSYSAYCAKGEELSAQCSPYVKELFSEVVEYGRQTYYDQSVQ